jgi:hypothetical protein
MATVNNPSQPYPQGAAPSQQPVATPPQQPVVMQPQQVILQPQALVQQEPTEEERREPIKERNDGEPMLKIVSHSNLLYWWPVWAVGFLMGILSYFEGRQETIGRFTEYFQPSNNLGMIWFVTLFLVILITNVPVRGLASGMVILAVITVTVVLAYFDLWDPLLRMLGNLSIHMNMGAYMFISALLFVVWVLSVFVFDQMTYWQITPGQVTRVKVFGAGQTSYETENMVLEKFRNDIFRHWVLGLGSGDMKVQTGGMNRQELDIPNVMFVGHKIDAFQRMIATKPDAFSHATVRG